MSTKVHPQFAEFRLKELEYQPSESHVENPLSDMSMFQTDYVISQVIDYVNEFAYQGKARIEYIEFRNSPSMAMIMSSATDFITITFDKSDYWIEIERTFKNQNNRKVRRKRKVNWIACHSCICDQHVQVNIEKLFR